MVLPAMFQITGNINNAIYFLERIGLRDVLIPFFLIFTIIYAVLRRVELWDQQRYDIIIALSISLLTVVPHITGDYPRQFDVVRIINEALPQIALLIVAIVMVMILTGLLRKEGYERTGLSDVMAVIAIIILVVIFASAFYPGATPDFLYFLDDPGFQSLLIAILVFGLVVWYVTGGEGDDDNEDTLLEKLMEKKGD